MKIWQEVENLKGRTLETLAHKKGFQVLNVTDEWLILKSKSRGFKMFISRYDVENAFIQLASCGEISRVEIQYNHSDLNSSYLAAVLAAIPGVRYELKPIRLFYEI
jgi:hypothetical protein